MIKSETNNVASLQVTESIIFNNDELLEQWDNFAEIAYSLPFVEGIQDKGLIKGIEALRAGYELIDGYVNESTSESGEPREEKVYAFLNPEIWTEDVTLFWHWMLMSLPQITVLKVDENKNIEFKTQSNKAIERLCFLANNNFGILYHGTLEEYYSKHHD